MKDTSKITDAIRAGNITTKAIAQCIDKPERAALYVLHELTRTGVLRREQPNRNGANTWHIAVAAPPVYVWKPYKPARTAPRRRGADDHLRYASKFPPMGAQS